jgi:hypothetical protein
MKSFLLLLAAACTLAPAYAASRGADIRGAVQRPPAATSAPRHLSPQELAELRRQLLQGRSAGAKGS